MLDESIQEVQRVGDVFPIDLVPLDSAASFMNNQIAFVHNLISTHRDVSDLLLDTFNVTCAVSSLKLLSKIPDAEKPECIFDFTVALEWSFVQKLLDLFSDDVGGPQLLSFF
ncbi:hypothetical protein AQ758_12260 [Burkholderia pseudomallei]|nr:hypothetical protein AQ757_14465 [Burkholderia pseudomallei]OMT42181.1 hypothetical protein AQ758_12260 [Burkholderia pseudomallei]